MNYRPYESQLAESYDRGATRYRTDDEVEAQSRNHQRLGGNLQRVCESFSRPIRVLEIGCGTGRYFHWLRNVELLVGTDISAEMLKHAEHPVLEQEITAKKIQLLQGSVYEMNFEPGAFDFIYSLGVFGYGAVVTPELCAKLHRWLAPGGWLYFDAIEVPHCASSKEKLREALFPHLPRSVQEWMNSRQAVPVVRHSRDEVQRNLQSAGFSDFVLASNHCDSPLWNGVHLECSACRSELSATHRAARMHFEFTGKSAA